MAVGLSSAGLSSVGLSSAGLSSVGLSSAVQQLIVICLVAMAVPLDYPVFWYLVISVS